ncbi:MFS transporter [uncultured Sphingomonas sp.]|uniref:MFS transporter n=1 Tax=uncultured Sphingomonas sp. TaxID=158754 RepID=UPI0035CC2130
MIRFEHRAIPIALAAVLIDTIGFGIIAPVTPRLLLTLGDGDIEHATRAGGWMLVVFAATQFLAGPVLGNLSDRYGRRPVLIASMLSFGIDYALMAWAPTLAWLFLGRAIAGVAGAVYGPAGSVIADVTPPERRGPAFALIGAAFGLGFIVGPALGGLMSYGGLRAPFIAAAVLALANAAAMFLLMPETLATEHRRPFRLRDAHIVGAFAPLFRAGRAAPLLLGAFLWQLAHMVYPATWGFWATARFGFDARAIGWSLALVGVLSVVVQGGLVGRIIAAIGERRTLIVGLMCGATSFLASAFVTAPWQIVPLFVVGAFAGLAMPAIQGLLSRMVDASHQGQLQGGMGSMGSVAAIVGPLMLTQALATGIDRGFPGAAFLVAGLLGLAAAGIIWWKVLGRVAAPVAPIA